MGRELGLRMPFYCAAGAFVVIFFLARPRLNTERIEQARQPAVGVVPQEGN